MTGYQAGLFSAVASAFIIQVESQLQSDPNDETAALLRVLIYKIDNTTFGSGVPALPQWTGPPRAIVQVQAILFSSLFLSLFSAFLAMLGKQWLNRYNSTHKRGSAIERSQNRQLKLDGVVTWYFDHVMELLPLMLQAALFLLGSALSLYLWEINTTVASVVLVLTSFGATCYLFIVIVGTIFESCPYQTPAAQFFRYIVHHARRKLGTTFRSTFFAIPVVASSSLSRLLQASQCCTVILHWWSITKRPWYSCINFSVILSLFLFLPILLLFDVCIVGAATAKLLLSIGKMIYYRLMDAGRTTHRWFSHSPRTLGPDQQTTMLDLRCISWVLRTSLDKAIHLSAFKHLVLIPELSSLPSTLVVDSFHIFTGCVNISGGKVVIAQGLEQLATVSAEGFLCTLRHLASEDPTSNVLVNLQRRYREAIPSKVNSTGLPFHSTMIKIHALANRFGNPRDIKWRNHELLVQEHIPFAHRMVEAAQKRHEETQHKKVPRQILRSVLYFLSLGPPSPASVVADSLTVVAIELGCEISDIPTLNERCVQFNGYLRF